MTQPTKKSIIDIYHRLVKEHGGRAIGERVFVRESSISRYYWQGGLWSSWSALQKEAGVAPNEATDKTPDNILLHRFAELALEMNAIPTEADLMVKRKSDSSFPSKSSFFNKPFDSGKISFALQYLFRAAQGSRPRSSHSV